MTDIPITLADRLVKLAIACLCALPFWVQRVIGGAPIVIDGQTLHPSTQMVLRLLHTLGGRTFESKPIAESRAEIRRQSWTFGRFIPICEIRDFAIDGPYGAIPMRLYRSHTALTNGPMLVYFHGGGWVLGGLDTGDSVCRFLARDANITILSVGYRLAPEHRFPIGLEDCLAAFDYAHEHASEFGCSPDLVGVAGESAGGTMAIVISQMAAKRARSGSGLPIPAFQIPFMPVTDLSRKHGSYRLFGEGFMLTEVQMDWYQAHYLNSAEEALDVRVSPLLTLDLGDQPPALIVAAGFDPLRDDALLYAQKLRDAGVAVEVILFPGNTHAEINATGVGGTAREMLRMISPAINRLIAKI
jgi:acetyl esterase